MSKFFETSKKMTRGMIKLGIHNTVLVSISATTYFLISVHGAIIFGFNLCLVCFQIEVDEKAQVTSEKYIAAYRCKVWTGAISHVRKFNVVWSHKMLVGYGDIS